eukprot:2358467-Lingulodinium_polyedra.AAC.1
MPWAVLWAVLLAMPSAAPSAVPSRSFADPSACIPLALLWRSCDVALPRRSSGAPPVLVWCMSGVPAAP